MPRSFVPVAWGIYLATSWTWCIGMILPILLMRDLGWMGFLLFAVPNIIGAGAMGWVIRKRAQSERFVASNKIAVSAFSLITLAFHAAAIPWIISLLGTDAIMPALAAAAVVTIAIALAGRERSPLLTILVWLLSAGLLGALLAGGASPASVDRFTIAPDVPELLMLAPVVIFGFALCPYLDATFHLAARSLDTKPRRVAFTAGFGGFFAVMILLTTLYAGPVSAALAGETWSLAPTLATWLPIHLGAQAGLTVALHAREGRPDSFCRYRWTTGVILALAIGFAMYVVSQGAGLGVFGISPGETVYRVFIGAYGLLAPTYVLLRVMTKPDVTIWARWALICMLASPAFGYGFLARDGIGLLIGSGIIIAGLPWAQLRKRETSQIPSGV